MHCVMMLSINFIAQSYKLSLRPRAKSHCLTFKATQSKLSLIMLMTSTAVDTMRERSNKLFALFIRSPGAVPSYSSVF